ncbi:alcohol dehydrogenase catalytic domain-containing protein [Streptomyces sp. URMC 123]
MDDRIRPAEKAFGIPWGETYALVVNFDGTVVVNREVRSQAGAYTVARPGGLQMIQSTLDFLLPPARAMRTLPVCRALDALDWKIRKGFFSEGKPLPGPAGTGIELAGTIDAVGDDVSQWQVGQAVFGRSATGGAAATHGLADADEIFAKPEWLSFEQAAALPVAVETAYRTLRTGRARGPDPLGARRRRRRRPDHHPARPRLGCHRHRHRQ